MERVDQAVVILKSCKSKGLSFYDARQILVQDNFKDEEIADAVDRFDYRGYVTPPLQPSLSVPETVPNTQQQSTYSEEFSQPTSRHWVNGPQAQLLFCLLSFVLVVIVGSRNTNMRNTLNVSLLLSVSALSASTIVYYGFIAKVICLGRYRVHVYTGGAAYSASLVWLGALVLIALQFLRLH
jgi:hypothetical protein